MKRPAVTSLAYFYGEQYFIRKLDLDGVPSKTRPAPGKGAACTMGVTMPDMVRDRIRDAILADNRQDAIIGKTKDGGEETWSSAFRRFFGIPLVPDLPEETIDDDPDNRQSNAIHPGS